MKLFFKDIEDVNLQNRQVALKRKIVALLSKSGNSLTIPEICRRVKLSVPTGTKLINELMESRIIIETGKMETESGRRPNLFTIDRDYAYCIGLVVQLKGLTLKIFNLGMEQVYGSRDSGFILENTPGCLDQVFAFIRGSVEQSGVSMERVLGLGIGITGRVNSLTGQSYNYFNFLENSVTDFIGNLFPFPVFIDNDTHVLGLAVQAFGEARNRKNCFVVNLSRGLGLVMISNGEIVTGENYFAGEFGHIQFADSERLCLCGKRGCLGTEVSGYALEQKFREKTAAGEVSLLPGTLDPESIHYGNIIDSAKEGDALSISLVHQIGFKLGKALGNMINLLNPGVIIIGGTFTSAREILSDAIKSGMFHTALPLPLKYCELMFSSIGPDAAVRGAGAMVLRNMHLI